MCLVNHRKSLEMQIWKGDLLVPLVALFFFAGVFFVTARIGEKFSFIGIFRSVPTLRLLNALKERSSSSSSDASVRNVRPLFRGFLLVVSGSLSLLNDNDDDDDDA